MERLTLMQGAWSDEQTSVIYDLLGVPESDRSNAVRADRHYQHILVGEIRNCGELARRQIARLTARVEELKPRDVYERACAESGNSDSVEIRRFQRYESALYSRIKWCLKQFASDETKPIDPAPEPSPTPDDETKPTEAGPVAETKPFSPEPPVSDRHAARLEKAEARRMAKLRKLERRRA